MINVYFSDVSNTSQETSATESDISVNNDWYFQAHKMGDRIHDIDITATDVKTVGEVRK